MNAPDTPLRFSLETLPFDNHFARLPGAFYTRLAPKGLPDPYLVGLSDEVATTLGVAAEELARQTFVAAFAGNAVLPGSEPLAAVYSGHQFGVWAGQLGDGRAHLLGSVATAQDSLELQLKGAGLTPYSRFADGRAVLRSSIREFLCSEAMAALGIPTTRALCIVGSDLPVRRETMETAAVVTRVAPSFLRFGSFEHWHANDRHAELKVLADYLIERFRPALRDEPRPYQALLRDVATRTAELVAQWQAVGFMHGVMNTDNMSVLGLTIDYGPFGFMEAFDADHICNHSDDHGRYSYRAQPHIAHWNLHAFAHALQVLVGDAETAAGIVDDTFVSTFNAAFMDRMRAKLGIDGTRDDDESLMTRAFGLMQSSRADFTQFWRALCELPAQADEARRNTADAPIRDLVIDRDAADAWLADWRARLAHAPQPDGGRQAAMRRVNPKYVLRNWIAEDAIRKAQAKDFSGVADVLQLLRLPFDEQPECDRYASPPPDWARGLSVSCSS